MPLTEKKTPYYCIYCKETGNLQPNWALIQIYRL